MSREVVLGTVAQNTLGPALTALDTMHPGSVAAADGNIRTAALWSQPLGFGFHGERHWAGWHAQLVLLRATPGLERLFVFHGDGHLREAALARLAGDLPSAFAVAAAILRLNDWVPEVRRAAASTLRRIVPLTEPQLVADAAFALLPRRDSWRRWGEEAAAFDEVVSRAPVVERLAALIRGSSGRPVAVLRQLLRGPALDPWLPTIASAARQPVVRAVALDALIEGRAFWIVGQRRQWVDKSLGVSRLVPEYAQRTVERPSSVETMIEQGLRDRATAVRLVAADAAIRRRATWPDLPILAERLAADRSQSVRERGEFPRRQVEDGGPSA